QSDRSQMNELIDIDLDAIYLFDRGYNDYKEFDKLCDTGQRFITRLKKNAEIEVLCEQMPDPENLIFKDQEVFLGNTVADTKMTYSLRLIETEDSEGNRVTIHIGRESCRGRSRREVNDRDVLGAREGEA